MIDILKSGLIPLIIFSAAGVAFFFVGIKRKTLEIELVFDDQIQPIKLFEFFGGLAARNTIVYSETIPDGIKCTITISRLFDEDIQPQIDGIREDLTLNGIEPIYFRAGIV